ncbi:MAG: nuclease A inhibitor family protein [Armatimonadota bacterium]
MPERPEPKEAGPTGKDSKNVLKILKAACKGLLFPSESDKPVKAFLWNKGGKGDNAEEGAATDEAALKAAGKVPEGAQTTELTVEKFFDPVITEEEWWGEEEKEMAKRYHDLIAALQHHLTDIKVFRVEGSGEDTYDNSLIDAYVVGRTGGELAGVSTQLIET